MVDLAILYTNELGDHDPAIALLDDAIKIRPLDFNFNSVRIDVLLVAGRLDEARRAIEHLESIKRWDDYFMTPRIQIDELQRKLQEAFRLRAN